MSASGVRLRARPLRRLVRERQAALLRGGRPSDLHDPRRAQKEGGRPGARDNGVASTRYKNPAAVPKRSAPLRRIQLRAACRYCLHPRWLSSLWITLRYEYSLHKTIGGLLDIKRAVMCLLLELFRRFVCQSKSNSLRRTRMFNIGLDAAVERQTNLQLL